MKERHLPTFDTGEINFVAACMSMGFPLNDIKPGSVIMRDDGKNYVRFHLYTVNIEGNIFIDDINKWWSDPNSCHNLAFSNIMEMIIAGVKQGCLRNSNDWLDFIIEYLTLRGITNHPKSMQDIPDFIERTGEHVIESQLCSFAYNREHAFQIVKDVPRSIMLTHGKNSHVRIDEHLQAWKRNELIARLRS